MSFNRNCFRSFANTSHIVTRPRKKYWLRLKKQSLNIFKLKFHTIFHKGKVMEESTTRMLLHQVCGCKKAKFEKGESLLSLGRILHSECLIMDAECKIQLETVAKCKF